MGMGTRARAIVGGGITALSLAVFSATPTWAQELVGQPTDGNIGLQPAASPLKVEAHFFHDAILMPIITFISLLVLGLLIWICIRYNKKANPVPAKWSHNTLIEIVWTVLPVLILVGISLFSFRLLFAYHDMPTPDLTIKATGNQWFWSYEYPDLGISFDAFKLEKDQLEAAGYRKEDYLLATDNAVVIPVGKTIVVQVTGADVIHAWAMPAFGVMQSGVPGRLGQLWFKADREGIYFGQCTTLCGKDHAYMPITVKVVSQAAYDKWVEQAKGGNFQLASN